MSLKVQVDRHLLWSLGPTTSFWLALLFYSWLVSWTLPVQAANKTWTLPISSSWTEPGRWTGGVPTATDSATFNQSGAYTVYFSSVFQDLNDMFISGGNVTFERLVTPATLTVLNASGGRDLTIGGATLNMGDTLPVNITVGDDTIINNVGTLNIRAGSFLNTQDLFVNAGGTLSLASGTITPSGSTQIDGAATISQGTFTSTNDVIVGNDGTGTLTISGAGHATSGNTFIGLSPTSSGTATVTGANASWGASSLTVGYGGSGTLLIQNGGIVGSEFTAGIGGAIGSTGMVTVTGADSMWSQQYLYVGGSGAGTLTVESGGAVSTTRETNIGGAPGGLTGSGTGSVSVSGTGSKLSTTRLTIGFIGAAGQLTIADGGLVRVDPYWLDNANRQTLINSASSVNIGAGGLAGTLDTGTVSNDGLLNFNHTGPVVFSTPITGTGAITKNGAGSTTLSNVTGFTGTFTANGGQLILQGSPHAPLYTASTGGTLRFDGSTVDMTGTDSIRSTGGTVAYSGATINGGTLRGQLPGAGTHTIVAGATNTRFNGVTIQNSVDLIQNAGTNFTNVTNGGRLTNNAFLFYDGGTNTTSGNITINQSLNTRDFTNYGQIAVNAGGTLMHSLGNLASGGGSRITVNTSGLINLMDGSELDLNGALLVNNGTLSGTVNVNYGSLAMGTGSFDVVNVNTGGVYAPGNSPGFSTAAAVTFDNAPVVSGDPMLAIELGGTTPGTQYDQLHVTGSLSLGGALAVSLIDGFTPIGGNSFDILDWGSLSGTFSSIHLPTASGTLTWDTSQLYTTGVLSVVGPPRLIGDYNEDNVVNAADYVVWRNNMGSLTALPNDNTPGVAQDDYARWVSNFGQTIAPSSAGGSLTPIPEPATWLLATFVCAGLRLAGRNRQDKDAISCFA